MHRIVWSFLLLMAILAVRGELQNTFRKSIHRKELLLYTSAGILLALNWLTYVWAISEGYVIQCSLEYFIESVGECAAGCHFPKRKAQTGPVGLNRNSSLRCRIYNGKLRPVTLDLPGTRTHFWRLN